MLALDEAIAQLSQTDPQTAELIGLRVFAGMTDQGGGRVLDISLRTVDRAWAYARAWLLRGAEETSPLIP